MTLLLFCPTCKQYTLETTCQICKGKTVSKKPARFSPQDHYGAYRRKLKQMEKNG